MRYLGIIALLLAVSAAWAPLAWSEVSVETNPAVVRVNEPFLLVVRASGRSVGEPQLPDVDGLQIEQQPSQQGDQYSMGTGMGLSVTKSRGYRAVASKTGKIVVPPIVVEIDDKPERSRQLVLNVGDAQSAPNPGQMPPSTPRSQPGRESAGSGGNPDPSDWVLVTANVDKREVYEGQPVKLVFSVWRIMYAGIETGTYPGANIVYPTTEGFYASDLQSYRNRRTHGGYDYDVTEYSQLLYPTTDGDLTIGPWHWEGLGRVWGFGGARQQPYSLSTDPIVIHVKPLPPGVPGFSGAVGSYVIEASLSRNQTMQGVPVDLDITISGRGNPDAVGQPELPKMDGVYVSEPEVNVSHSADESGVAVQKQMSYTLTPLNAGDFEVPKIAYVYFDPETGQFKRSEAGPFALKVLPSTEHAAPMVTAQNLETPTGRVDILNEDIHPIITRPLQEHGAMPSAPLTGGCVAAPVMGYAFFALFMVRKRRFAHDTAYARSYHAKAKALKRLSAADSEGEAADALFKALSGYLADKCNVSEAGMTASDAERLLSANAVNNGTRENILKILKSCERARYASVRLSSDEVKALTSAAMEAVQAMEKTFGKEGRPC